MAEQRSTALEKDVNMTTKTSFDRGEVGAVEKGPNATGQPIDDERARAEAIVSSFSRQDTRRIMRKIDYRVIPLLGLLYLLAYIDRSNLGNALIAGMEEDLNLYGNRYNIALTVFFIPYTLLEVPSNIVLKILRPSLWIAILCFSWGTVMTLMGLVNSYQGLVIARLFLGVAEAGFFPAAAFLLTIWYKRFEVQSRMGIFYGAASLAGAFSGLLAYGIENMEGIAGLAGWKWIFILEGLAPVVVSFFIYWALPDSPETASFLTPEERQFVVHRLALQTGSGFGRMRNDDKMSWTRIREGFSEWKVWCAILPFWSCSIGTYGFTATLPTVIKQLGYSSANAQLMTIPIYTAAIISIFVVAFWSDRVQRRTPFIVAGFSISVVGFIAQLAIPKPQYPGLSYAFIFFIAVGLYCPYTSLVTLIANNLDPSSRRAVGMALLISVGNMGGICGSNIYLKSQSPRYPVGFGMSLAMNCVGIVATWVLRKAYQKENKKRDALLEERGEAAIRAEYTDEQLANMGDRSPFFRYAI